MFHDFLFSLSDCFLVFDYFGLIYIIFRYFGTSEIEKKTHYVDLFSYILVMFCCLIYLQFFIPSFSAYYYNHLFMSSQFIIFIRVCIYSFAIICILFVFVENKNILCIPLSEFILLIPLLVLGISLSVASNDLFCIFLFIELQSLVLYIFIALAKNSNLAIEAAFKYFLIGTFASLVLIFGISLLYYNFGTCSLDNLAILLTQSTISFSAKIGIIFICCGLLSKLGMAPFHYWVADVYQGTHSSIIAILAILTKLPILVIFLKLYLLFITACVDLKFFIIIFSICSIYSGIFSSMYEVNLKRFLAFSAVSHMGFIVLGRVVATPDAYFASVYYMLIYILNNIILFGILLIFVEPHVDRSSIFFLDKLQTLVIVRQSNFIIAVCLGMVFLSIAGVPPFAGFFAKFFILKALWDSGHILLCLLGLVASLLSSIYYLRCIRFLFFAPEDRTNYSNVDYSKHVILVTIIIFFSFLGIISIFIQPSLIIYLHSLTLLFFRV